MIVLCFFLGGGERGRYDSCTNALGVSFLCNNKNTCAVFLLFLFVLYSVFCFVFWGGEGAEIAVLVLWSLRFNVANECSFFYRFFFPFRDKHLSRNTRAMSEAEDPVLWCLCVLILVTDVVSFDRGVDHVAINIFAMLICTLWFNGIGEAAFFFLLLIVWCWSR